MRRTVRALVVLLGTGTASQSYAAIGYLNYSGVFTSASGDMFATGESFTGQLRYDDTFGGGIGGEFSAGVLNTMTFSTQALGSVTVGNGTGSLIYSTATNVLRLFQSASSAGTGSQSGFDLSYDAGWARPVVIRPSDLAGLTTTISTYAQSYYPDGQGGGTMRGGYGMGTITFAGSPIVHAVPEPASWALVIGGIGFAGGMARRQRARAAVS